jgi:hypothetical protein
LLVLSLSIYIFGTVVVEQQSIDGEYSIVVGILTALTELWLNKNQLTGTIPSSLALFVATSDVGDALVNPVTSLKPPYRSFTTQGYFVAGRLDDKPDTTTSSTSWVEVVGRRKPVVKQSGAVLTLFTK